MEIAIDFDDSMNPDSAINKEAQQQKVTLIRAKDFWKLILMAIPNQLNFAEVKEFLEKCHSVPETSTWIEDLSKREINNQLIKEILQTAWELIKIDKKETPHIQAIRAKNETLLKRYNTNQIKDIVNSLNLLVPNLIYLDEQDRVNLLTNPERILECVKKVVESQVPPEYIQKFERAFENKLNHD